MQNATRRTSRTWLILNLIAALSVLTFLNFSVTCAAATNEPSLTDKAKATAKEAKDKVAGAVEDATHAVEDAGHKAAESLENLWRRVDETRLKNRSPDELVAWAIMGVLAGSLAGMLSPPTTSGFAKFGRLLLGLGGALIGGMVVHVAQINFGWGPVLIRYEELVFSLAGAFVLLVLMRLFRFGSKKSSAE